MTAFRLNDQELKAPRAAHRGSRGKHPAYRLNAVVLLGCGWTPTEVSEALLIDGKTYP